MTDSASLVGLLTFVTVGVGLELAEHRLALGSAKGSIAFVSFMGAALVFGPMWGAVVAAVSIVVAQVVNGRSSIKIAFNVSQYVFAVVAGTLVYMLLGGEIPATSLNESLAPFFGFTIVFFLANSGAVSGVISLSEQRSFTEVWVRNTWALAAYDLIAGALGLAIAFLYVRFGVVGVAGIVVPILFLRHTYSVNLQLQATNRELLDLMVKAIEARDPYTSGHSQRVSQLARTLAREMKLSFREVENIRTAALLHDVGKIFEEFAPLLRKQDKLTPEERRVMQSHPVRSAELVGTISSLRGPVERYVRHHHESFDGSGYPDGLVGEDIPVGARIIMIADTVDAMTTDRPYRHALSYDRMLEELIRHAGAQFDPRIVAAFRRSVAVRQLVDPIRPAMVAASVGLPEKGERSAPRWARRARVSGWGRGIH